MNRKSYLTGLAIRSTAAMGSAYAAKVMGKVALAIETAKIGLTQAVATSNGRRGDR